MTSCDPMSEKRKIDLTGLECDEKLDFCECKMSRPRTVSNTEIKKISDGVPRLVYINKYIGSLQEENDRRAAIIASNLPVAMQANEFSPDWNGNAISPFETEGTYNIEDINDWLRLLGFTGSTRILDQERLRAQEKPQKSDVSPVTLVK